MDSKRSHPIHLKWLNVRFKWADKTHQKLSNIDNLNRRLEQSPIQVEIAGIHKLWKLYDCDVQRYRVHMFQGFLHNSPWSMESIKEVW